MLLLMISVVQSARAQMFSVEGGTRQYNTPTVSGHIGIEPVTFKYIGNTSVGGAGIFAFEGSIIRVRLDTPNLLLTLGKGGNITNLDNHSYLDAALKALFGLSLIRSEQIHLEIPFQLTSSLTNVVTDQFTAQQIEFRQANVIAGAGLRLGGRVSDRFRIQLITIPSYGFSTATGGSFGGSLFKVEAQARIYYDRVFGSVGLSAGYDYSFKNFDIEGQLFDYELNSHGFLIGVTF